MVVLGVTGAAHMKEPTHIQEENPFSVCEREINRERDKERERGKERDKMREIKRER